MLRLQKDRSIKYVKIFSDSQAAVAALDSSDITSQAVKDTKNSIKQPSR